MNTKRVAVSGGFDPLHIGHVRMFAEAQEKFGPVYVILNSDEFLLNKKGKVFMPFEERKELLESLRYVYKVIPCIDEDETVCRTLRMIMPDVFANGGDRTDENIPEWKVCKDLQIETVFGIGGEKIQSSSDLCKNYEVQ